MALLIILFLGFSGFLATEGTIRAENMYRSDIGSSFHLLDLDYFGMRAAKFGDNRDPMIPQQDQDKWVGRVAADFRLRMLEVFYWNNEVHAEGIEAQVKTVGWHWELGLHILPALDMFYEHHSRHIMEGKQPLYIDPHTGDPTQTKFPVEDSYGLRLNFYISNRPTQTLIP